MQSREVSGQGHALHAVWLVKMLTRSSMLSSARNIYTGMGCRIGTRHRAGMGHRAGRRVVGGDAVKVLSALS